MLRAKDTKSGQVRDTEQTHSAIGIVAVQRKTKEIQVFPAFPQDQTKYSLEPEQQRKELKQKRS